MSFAIKSFVPAAESSFRPDSRLIKVVPQRAFAPCAHEGNIVTFCARGDDGHLRQCGHPDASWDNCRRSFGGAGEGDCSRCPLHSRNEVGNTRHLLYFVCPMSRNGIWQKNVEMLLKRINLFNGKRIVAIATGNPIRKCGIRPRALDAPEEVEAMFAGHGCEFIHVVNNPAIGEVVAWEQLWERVLPGDAGDVTFYGHAKGVGKPTHEAVKRWTEILYETNLDYWPLVQEQLRKYPLTGSFKKLGYCFMNQCRPSRFHYSGSFVWIRNADMATQSRAIVRDWRAGLKQEYAGTEAVWGILYKSEEAGCIFHEAFGTVMNLYSHDYWNRVAGPAYMRWLQENEAKRTIPAAQMAVIA